VDIWRATWQLIREHPIVGVGFAGYQVAIPSHHDSSGRWVPQQAHNEYLELLASGGLIAAALGIWFGAAFIVRARRQLQSADLFRRAACIGALTGIVGAALHSFVDFGLHVTINALILTVLIVIATMKFEQRDSVLIHSPN
jgi:O-antigen ligase